MIIRQIPAILAIAMTVACGGKTNPPATGSGSSSAGSGDGAGQLCGSRGLAACPADQFCSYEVGAECGAADKPGHCMGKPQACPRIAAPVCGCDGKTYGNSCEASAAATGVKATGPCS